MEPRKQTGKMFSSLVVALMCCAFGAGGCAIKAEGGDPQGAPVGPRSRFADKKPSITGPKLEGEWESSCIAVMGGPATTYRKIRVRFNDEQVDRMQLKYIDGRCERLESALVDRGTFRFIEAFPDAGFTVEYSFEYGNGIITNPQEKIWKDAFEMFLTDLRTGDALTRANGYRLTRVGGVSDSKPIH